VVVLHCCIPFSCNHLVNLMKTLDYSVSLEVSKTLPMLAILPGKHEANKITREMFTYMPILLICLWKGKPKSKSVAGAFGPGLAVYKYGQCCSPRQTGMSITKTCSATTEEELPHHMGLLHLHPCLHMSSRQCSLAQRPPMMMMICIGNRNPPAVSTVARLYLFLDDHLLVHTL